MNLHHTGVEEVHYYEDDNGTEYRLVDGDYWEVDKNGTYQYIEDTDLIRELWKALD